MIPPGAGDAPGIVRGVDHRRRDRVRHADDRTGPCRPRSPAAARSADLRADRGRLRRPHRIRHPVTLVGFGTRHTLSETESETRGIGAARRWISSRFLEISEACGGCLEVSFQRTVAPGEPDTRIPVDTEIVNVVAVIRGATDPNRYVVMSGDIDNRISDPNNFTDDSPGANDNASGMAGAIEAAQVLSGYAGTFNASIVLVGLSGEENGLLGGAHMAELAVTDAGTSRRC